jgi:hypothetical protein
VAEFPKTRQQMERMMYTRTSVATCKNCGAAIEWWTTTHGKSLPMNPMPYLSSAAIVHLTTCPKVQAVKPLMRSAEGATRQESNLESDVRSLRNKLWRSDAEQWNLAASQP